MGEEKEVILKGALHSVGKGWRWRLSPGLPGRLEALFLLLFPNERPGFPSWQCLFRLVGTQSPA